MCADLMITDNQWHPAILIKTKPGFVLVDSMDDAELLRATYPAAFSDVTEFMEVRVNYNRGQPIVDFGDFTAALVDMERAG